MDIVNLLIQLVSGGAGGLGAGKALPKLSLGKIGDIIAGVLGGLGGGQLLGSIIPSAAAAGSFDLTAILTSLIGGGVGGGALMAIVSAVKNALAKK